MVPKQHDLHPKLRPNLSHHTVCDGTKNDTICTQYGVIINSNTVCDYTKNDTICTQNGVVITLSHSV